MIEVPSTVLVLPHLIGEVDFVSVGTNDLVQYLLAVDRDNPWVAKLYDPQHPAVVEALARVARIARAAGKPCSVCGEMAGDYATALMLLGMGYDSVSVVPYVLPEVKYAVRETSGKEADEIAAGAAAEKTCEGVRRVLARARERLHHRQLDRNSHDESIGDAVGETESKKGPG
jgi:phosphotransferase system enzyme I (PtsP)